MKQTSPPNIQAPLHGLAFSTRILAVTAVAFSLAACGRDNDTTVGENRDAVPPITEQRADGMPGEARDQYAAASSSTSNLGQQIDDATITASVNAELAKDERLSALKINVDTSQGSVTLSGTAPDLESRDRAARLASGVEGVVSVDNKLEINS